MADDLEFAADAAAAKAYYDTAVEYVLPPQVPATPGNVVAIRTVADLVDNAAAKWRGDALPNRATQNDAEAEFTFGQPFTFGAIEAPPMARAAAHKGVDLIAHWYNDFGLQRSAVAAEANGWWGWYDWRWNHTDVVGYDPQRHPVLGWYAGDDPNVLDWISYWLVEAGINVVSLTQPAGFSRDDWTTPTDPNYWIYRLLTQAPNMRGLRYMLWSGSSGTTASIEAGQDDIMTTAQEIPGAYTYVENSLTYLCIFVWDMEAVRGVYDAFSGQTNTVAMLKNLAAKAQAVGYNGVMVLARNGGVVTATPDTTLHSAGCIVIDASYEDRYGSDPSYGDDYSTYADTAVFPTDFTTVPNVATSGLTMAPHPTGWDLADSTPEAFGRILARGVQSVLDHGQRRMLTIYNVSEWAEGGPGLIPQMGDGWGYLDAIKRLTPAIPNHIPYETPWTLVPASGPGGFQNSWANFGSGIQPLRFRRIGDRVEVQGLINAASSGLTVFPLPVGYRPPAIIPQIIIPTVGGYAVIDVAPGGAFTVTIVGGGTAVAINATFYTS